MYTMECKAEIMIFLYTLIILTSSILCQKQDMKEEFKQFFDENVENSTTDFVKKHNWRACFLPESIGFCKEQCNSTECTINIATAETDCHCDKEVEIKFAEHLCKARCIKGFCESTNCTCLSSTLSHYTDEQECTLECPVKCVTVSQSSREYSILGEHDLLCNWECPCATSSQCQQTCLQTCTESASGCFECLQENRLLVENKTVDQAQEDSLGLDEEGSSTSSSPLGLLPLPVLIGVVIGVALLLAIIFVVVIVYRHKRGGSHNMNTRNEYHKQEPVPEVSEEPLVA